MSEPLSYGAHYETLLAEHYVWAFGGEEAMAASAEAFAAQWLPAPKGSGKVLDLGCGPGFHSLALARRGFKVLALDTSPELLALLDSAKGELPIQTVRADLRDLGALDVSGMEAVLCLGDTLSHLGSTDEVRQAIAQAVLALEPGGLLLLGFRDQSHELAGADRCFMMRSDPERLFTCCLEYGPDFLLVTDLVHQLGPEGWTLAKSCYRKARLTRDQVAGCCLEAGLALERETMERGMVTLAVRRPLS